MSMFSRLGIRGRLLAAFLTMSGFSLLATIAALLSFGEVHQAIREVSGVRVPTSFAALELSREAERLGAAAPKLALSSSTAEQVKMDREIRAGLAQLDRLVETLQSSDLDSEVIVSISQLVVSIRQNLSKLQLTLDPFDYLSADERLSRAMPFLEANREAAARLSREVDQLVESERAEIGDAVLSIGQTQYRSSIVQVAIIALSLLTSLLVVWFYVGKSIVGRIIALTHSMLALAQGDHQVQLPEAHGSDELARMASSLRIFRDTAIAKERTERLKRFLAPQVAELIVSSGNENMLASHRQEIAVLFCDLRGFTSFAELHEPEEVMAVLRSYHDGLGRLVQDYEGTLERFTGDGMIVLFNDPVPCQDPCLKAARLALAMRKTARNVLQRPSHLTGKLGFSIGIAFGYATLGKIGYEGRFDYTAIGSVVNLAARLCEKAAADQVLIDGRVRAAIDWRLPIKRAGEMKLKGFSRPLAVFELTDATDTKTRARRRPKHPSQT